MRKLVSLLCVASLAACTPMMSPNDPATAQDQQGLQGVGVFLTAMVITTVAVIAAGGGHASTSGCDIHAVGTGDSCVCLAGYIGDGTTCLPDTSHS